MRFMYLRGNKVREVEAATKQEASQASVLSGPYVSVGDLKAWIPEDERCVSHGWRGACLNKRKDGQLCGVHALEARRKAERDAVYQQRRERLEAATALRDRIKAATGILGSVSWTDASIGFGPDDAAVLADWVEAAARAKP